MKKAYDIEIDGLVQGVGFRPFVYRLAKKHHLNGWVKNRNDCVEIKVEGEKDELEMFLKELKTKSPKTAKVYNLNYKEELPRKFPDFKIISSENISESITQVSADLAVCDHCLEDLTIQKHRINYPFINCTYCGPRFSIIKSLPYDRPNTTMMEFEMCKDCGEEYNNVNDRRFHAQPIACNECGPHYSIVANGKSVCGDEEVIAKAANIINKGGIVAIKGIGGFFIACDANLPGSVARLRNSKKRYSKPFALMLKDIDTAKIHTEISEQEERVLTSIQRPIVLVKQKKREFEGVNDGLGTLGIMLPYMPLHYLLFNKLSTNALVFTSGNISEEPISIDNKEAEKKLGGFCDAVITHNREIHNRVDDSVVMISSKKNRMIRRSRGYAPEPIPIDFNCEGIFATGAELTNSFAIGKGKKAILSQFIGDLKNYDTYTFYKESFERYCHLFRFNPSLIVCDLHPDYLSTKMAESFDVPIIKVQHHHAHLASCLVENHFYGEAIGVCLDGTGYGLDGNIWGGEFLVGDLCDFERSVQFEYVPISGGDLAAHHPWRSALSYLHFHGIDKKTILKLLPGVEKNEAIIAMNSLEREINCPLSSSAGRLFDAIAALTGLCLNTGYHAEAPMILESKILKHSDEFYQFEIFDNKISFRNTITDIIDDLKAKESIRLISTKFHNTIADLVARVSLMLRDQKGINTVALSGGTFQNSYLLDRCISELERKKFHVLSQQLVPSNDGGIALGQLAIAAVKQDQLCV